MKNGDYIMIKAPEGYPGKKYRDKYCYEHHLVFWTHFGRVPKDGEVIHHINGDKHDNRIENLRLMKADKHCACHGNERGRTFVKMICPWCGNSFSRERRQTFLVKGTHNTFCSRDCAKAYQKSRGSASTIVIETGKHASVAQW